MKRPWIPGWALFALLYFSLGFCPGVVRSDDFGYLRSVLGTLERGRPYVYEWLEPFGAAFSSACALLYLATGDFLLSTWGFQAVCVLALYPLLYRLIAARLASGHAAVLTLALATFPIFFAKEADFHAGICTLDLFLLSLIFFEKACGKGSGAGSEEGIGKTNPAWFFLTAFLAFANRQNHIVLLLLPAWIARRNLRSRPVLRDWVPGTLAFLGAAAGLFFSMNRTYASANAGFLHAGPLRLMGDSALALAAGAYLALGWLGAFSALAGRAGGRAAEGAPGRANWRGTGLLRWAMPLAATLGLLALKPFWHDTLLHTDTTLFGLAGWPQVNRLVPWLLFPALWLLDYRLLRPSPYLILCAGYLGIAALRGTLWDYYFLEISILCLLSVLDFRRAEKRVEKEAEKEAEKGTSGVTSSLPVRGPEPALPRLGWPALAVLGAVLAGNLAYAYLLKVQSDKQAITVRAFERLEREGRITVDAMTGSTFGYLGWKLFDWFIARDGREFGELAGFMGYARRDRVMLETGLPWRSGFKGPLPPGAVLLDSGHCRVGFARVRYRIADWRGPDSALAVMGRTLTLDTAGYRAPRFPLNGREWRALADSARRRH